MARDRSYRPRSPSPFAAFRSFPSPDGRGRAERGDGGALAPIAAQALAERGGLGLVGAYPVVAGVLSLAGLSLLRSTPR